MNKTDPLQLARGLIERGDSLLIKSGLLEIYPKSGKKVPCEWLSDNEEGMVATLLWMTRRKGYRYIRFTRSGEGYSGGRFPGVTLHFREVESDHNAYLVFNTQVIKASGELRKKNEFLPPADGSLVKFWKRTVGNLPNQRRSRMWEHMGKLKPYLYQINTRPDGKGENKPGGLLNIPFEDIKASLTDEQRTDSTDGNIPQSNVSSGLEVNPITCRLNHELSHQERKISRKPYSSVDVSNKTTEEWLEHYSSLD
jgi:hypothetical protein